MGMSEAREAVYKRLEERREIAKQQRLLLRQPFNQFVSEMDKLSKQISVLDKKLKTTQARRLTR